MSHEASSWAFAQHRDLSSGAKFLLVAIANRADKSGVAWCGHATLADDCACRVETVSSNIKRLEALGLLVRFQRRRKNRSRTSDWVVLAPAHEMRLPMIDAPADEYPEAVVLVARVGVAKSSVADSSSDLSSCEENTRSHFRKTGGPEQEEETASTPDGVDASPPNPLIAECDEWLGHHQRITGLKSPRSKTAARREAEAMYRARRGEGYSAEDLKTATVGAFNDPFRRENGHYGAVSVLRPKKVHDLVEKGRVFIRQGNLRGAGQLSQRDTCRKCSSAITNIEANSQSGMCGPCYQQHMAALTGGEAA